MHGLPLIPISLLAAFTAGAAIGYQWRDTTAKLHESREQQRYTAALNDALDKARKQEQSLYAQLEALSRDTEKQLQAVAAAERAAADTRVRDLAADYARRSAGTDSPATPSCEAERTRAAVLADLLGQLDPLAQGYAAAADRNRIAGLACEQAYEAARNGEPH